jgi:hypothetical protein
LFNQVKHHIGSTISIQSAGGDTNDGNKIEMKSNNIEVKHDNYYDDDDDDECEAPSPAIVMHEVRSSIYSLLNDTKNFKRKEFKKPKHIPQQQTLQINPMILLKKGINHKGKSRLMLTQTNNNEIIIKQNDIMLIANNNKMGNFRNNNYFKYSGRYRSRMLRMNRNDSSINNISSIDEKNEVNENNSSNNQASLSGNIDIYHKQLGPGLSLVQCNTNDEGSVMIDDDIDSDRYPSWFLLSVNHHHNQSQLLTPLKALATDYIQQSERSPYNDNDSKIRAMLKQPLIKKEFNNNSSNHNDDVYDNQLNYNNNESSYTSDDNNIINNLQHNLPIQKEKIDFPQYLLKLQQSEKLPSVDILSLPKRVVISSELSINLINTQKEIKVTTSSLKKEDGDDDDDIDNDDNDDHGIDNVDNIS